MFLRSRRANQKEATSEVDYDEPTDGSRDLPEVIIGREDEASFLVQDLLGNSGSNYNQFKALGIAGTAGSGKTSICQKMFNSPQVQEHFLPRIWVCMTRPSSDDAEPKVTVTKRMLTCLGEDEEIIEEKHKKDGISGLVSLLHRQLVGKRYLIVLDGACNADKWFNLGSSKNNSCLDSVDHWRSELNNQKWSTHMSFTPISISDYSIQHKPDKGKNLTWVHSTDWGQSLAFGLPKGYGGAVIVNGRSDKVVKMMVGKENLHHLLPLTNKDCLAIFEKASGVVPECGPQVLGLQRFVVQGVGGHPLMAKLMGRCYKKVKDTAQQAADNSNDSTGEESTIQQASGSNGSSTAHVTGLEASQVTALQPVNSSNGSSIAQVTGPEASQITASQPVNSSDGSFIAQVSVPELAQVTAPPAVGSNGSSTDQVTGPEASQVTTPQPVNSSNSSSIAQVPGPESAQVTAPPLADSSNRSSLAQETGQNQPRLPPRKWSIVAKVFRLKNLLGQTNRSYRTAGNR